MTTAMDRLAHGDLDVAIYGEGRTDEIGVMASTVAVFRDNARERVRLEAEASESRRLAEQQRLERERRRQRRQQKCALPLTASAMRLDNCPMAG